MKKDNRSIDEIVESLAKDEKIIVKRLRALVLECLPYVSEQNSYGVPFYRRNRMICFIWPPSVYWGPKKENHESRGVTLGFCQGNKMLNDEGLLLSEGRKQVYCMYFKHVSEIDDRAIKSLLYEADLIDGSFGKKKTRGALVKRKREKR
jgi:hypothetical protein